MISRHYKVAIVDDPRFFHVTVYIQVFLSSHRGTRYTLSVFVSQLNFNLLKCRISLEQGSVILFNVVASLSSLYRFPEAGTKHRGHAASNVWI